jgi:hypothetical protein
MAIPVTFTAGSVLEANQLNSNFTSVYSTYTAYTPTITGWTQGNATFDCRYAVTGDTVNAVGYFLFGSTSAVTATTLKVSLPVSGYTTTQNKSSGICTFNDVSASVAVAGTVQQQTATESWFYWHDPETVPLAVRLESWVTSATLPFTFATGDFVYWNISYQKA